MVRYVQGHKEESRARIIEAAGRGFRKRGYGGIGVDGLAREAGVTHGAFYGHFRSKAEAFEVSVVAGLQALRGVIESLRVEHGGDWLREWATFYMGDRCTCDLADSCTLPSLSAEVERADLSVRTAYAHELAQLIEAVANGLTEGTGDSRRARARALLSLLAGGVTLTRAIPDTAESKQMADAIISSALAIAKVEQA